MTTTVLYRVPRGYLSEINRTRELLGDATENDVILKWVTDKFGVWILDNITADFVFANANPTGFDIVFDHVEHARQFVREVGGVIR